MRVTSQKSRVTTMRIKKNDVVKVIAGNHKGKTAKVVKTDAQHGQVFLENVGMIKRHTKPSQVNPRGGTKEIHRGLPISNVALVVDEAKGKTAKVGYKTKADVKVRINRSNGKELA